MDRFLVGFLILANAQLLTAMAGEKDRYFIAEGPMAARKLGKHDINGGKIAASDSSSSPSGSPESEANAEHLAEASISGAGDGDSSVLEINHHHHHHHSWIDEPAVGGVVILGGLVAAFLATVFWYIRVTRGRNAEQPPSSPTNSSILIPDKERS